MYLIKHKNIELDICTNFHCFGFGISCGINRFIKYKMANFYIEIHLLFWLFGLEAKFDRK